MKTSIENNQEITKLKLQINKYKKTEKALLNKLELYDSYSKDTNCWIWEIDLLGNYTSSNSAVESILGYKIDEILNVNVTKIWFTEEKKSTDTLKQLKTALKNKIGWKIFLTTLQHKNGSIVYTESTAYPIYDENDKILGYKGIDHDITKQKITEDKLKKSEKQFRMIAENTNDLITITNLNLKANYTYISPSIKQISGFNVDELIGKSAFDFMHPGDKKKMFTFLRKVMKKSISNIFQSHSIVIDEIIEYRALHKSGKYRFMQSSGSIIGGKMLFVSRDITEHKEMVGKLKKSEEQFKMIAENTKDAISIQKFNSKMTYLYLSPGFEELFGYSPEEYIGKSPFDFMHPDDKLKIIPMLKEYLGYQLNNLLTAEKRKVAITVESRMKVKSGEWRYFQAINKISGKYVITVSRDITEQKQAQEKLRTSEHRLIKAKEIANIEFFEYDLINDKVFVTDRVNTIYNLNAKNNIVDPSSIYILTHPDDKVLIKNIIEQVREGETPSSIDYRVVRPNKDVIWLKANFELSFDINNKPKCLFVTLLDITERKKAEEGIEQARERLSIANSILRHDITNDITVIQSALRIFKMNADPIMLDEISKRISKSINLIRQHRLQEKFIDSFNELKKIELVPTLHHIINNFGEIEINISGSETVYADSAINSVFENLFSNSIRHGNATKIDIIISSHKKICEIKVIDNGKGIDENIIDRIFDKGFFHGDNGHTGIGLHIVKQTISFYGGEILVKSNNPCGAVFIISLKKVI